MKKRFLKRKDKSPLHRNDQDAENKLRSKKHNLDKTKYKHASHWMNQEDYDPSIKDEEE